MLLSELQKYIRREVTRHQILENLKQAKEYLKNGKLSDKELKGLLGIDPTPQKKYVGWMAKKWIEGGKKEIDAQQLEDYIPTYDKLVSTNKIDERDINKFKTIKDLADKIEVIQSTGEDISTSSLEKDADVVLDNEDLLIMSPHTHEASRKLGLSAFAHRKCKGGKDSAWCTTYKSPDHFNNYYYTNKVTFYYTKVLSEDIMEQLQVAFPRRYQALVVMAFAIIPKGGSVVVDAYDGKDKRIPKKDIEKIVEILGIGQYLVSSRIETRDKRRLQLTIGRLKKSIGSPVETDEEGLPVRSDYNFDETKIPFTLPENLTVVNGDLSFVDVAIPFNLPEKLEVINGHLSLDGANIDRLPSSLRYIKGRLSIDANDSVRDASVVVPLKEFPPNLKYVRDLYLGQVGAIKLPENFKCEDMRIVYSRISEIPASIKVKDVLTLRGNPNIKSIPQIKTKNLDIDNCNGIQKLPENLDVEKLELENCKGITTLPSAWKVKELIIQGCPKINQIPSGKYDRIFIDNCPGIKSLPNGLEVAELEGDTVMLPQKGIIGYDESTNSAEKDYHYNTNRSNFWIPDNMTELSPELVFNSSVLIKIGKKSKLRNLPYGDSFDLQIYPAPFLTNDSFPKQKQKIGDLALYCPTITQIPSNITVKELTLGRPEHSRLTSVPKGLKKLELHYKSLVAIGLYNQFPKLKRLAKKIADYDAPDSPAFDKYMNTVADSLGILPASDWSNRIYFTDWEPAMTQ